VSAIAAERDDLRRWVASAALVLALHAAGVALLLRGHEPLAGDEGSDAVVVDLAPYVSLPNPSPDENVAPGPLQQEFEPPPPPPKPEQKVEPKIEPPPPVPQPEAVLPPETVTPPDTPVEEPQPAVPQTMAPPPPRPSAAQISSWHREIVLRIEREKTYPPAARAAHEVGTAQLAFTIDREGRLLASRILRSSGSGALDQETIATVRRAQPFPAAPPNMPGDTFEFTLPVKFNIR
jgi:protein TonB